MIGIESETAAATAENHQRRVAGDQGPENGDRETNSSPPQRRCEIIVLRSFQHRDTEARRKMTKRLEINDISCNLLTLSLCLCASVFKPFTASWGAGDDRHRFGGTQLVNRFMDTLMVKSRKSIGAVKCQFPPPSRHLATKPVLQTNELLERVSVFGRFWAYQVLPNFTKFYQFRPKVCSEPAGKGPIRADNEGFWESVYLNRVKSQGACQAVIGDHFFRSRREERRSRVGSITQGSEDVKELNTEAQSDRERVRRSHEMSSIPRHLSFFSVPLCLCVGSSFAIISHLLTPWATVRP